MPRHASFHLGVGSTNSKDPRRNLHLDFILANCRIGLGSQTVLNSGKFFLPDAKAIPERQNYAVEINLHDAL